MKKVWVNVGREKVVYNVSNKCRGGKGVGGGGRGLWLGSKGRGKCGYQKLSDVLYKTCRCKFGEQMLTVNNNNISLSNTLGK